MAEGQKGEHPALAASKRSWSAVHRKAKDEWLALFAADAIIEDPVGPSPIDPEGKGHIGKEAIAAFWDRNVGPNTIRIDLRQAYCAGQEVAHVGTLANTLPNGALMTVEGVFVYKVNDEGKLVSLRGFWDFDRAVKTMRKPG